MRSRSLDDSRIAQAANCLWLLELDRRRMTAESSAATCGSFPEDLKQGIQMVLRLPAPH
ncbi:MAG: hypothetical protein U0936_13900 [Planctomycetaceae bacterium]